LIDGVDKEYTKFHRRQFSRKLVVKHNIGEHVVLDRIDPFEMSEEIALLYSDIVKPFINKFAENDLYSVIIKSDNLKYEIFLGK